MKMQKICLNTVNINNIALTTKQNYQKPLQNDCNKEKIFVGQNYDAYFGNKYYNKTKVYVKHKSKAVYNKIKKYENKGPIGGKYNINPVVSELNGWIEKTTNIARRKVYKLNEDLENITTVVKIGKKSQNTSALDINNNNRTKYVIFMHGFGQNNTHLNLQKLYKEIIDKTDYAVLAPEYRGFFNNNDKTLTKFSQRSINQDAQNAIQYLIDKGIKSEDISIIGHSFGAYPASRLANKNSEIEQLILVSPYNKFAGNYGSDICHLNEKKFLKFIYEKCPIFNHSLETFCHTGEQLEKVNAPTSIIYSKNDNILPEASFETLASECPNSINMLPLQDGKHIIEKNKINYIISLLNENK